MAQRYKNRRTLPSHEQCVHLGSHMDCEEYERLIAKTKQRCTLCDARPEDTCTGRLLVDHDHSKGPQAVRGLLCDRCNAAMRHVDSGLREPNTRQRRYLKYPWYLSQLAPEHREWWINRPSLSYERQRHWPGGFRLTGEARREHYADCARARAQTQKPG